MTESDRRALQAHLNRSLDDLMEELSLYDPTARGVADVWQKIVGPLHQRLCVEWVIVRFGKRPGLKTTWTWQ